MRGQSWLLLLVGIAAIAIVGFVWLRPEPQRVEIQPENETYSRPAERQGGGHNHTVRHYADTSLVSYPTASTFQDRASRSEIDFVGADACAECHPDVYEGFIETTHHNALLPATRETVAGSFEPGENVLQTGNPNLRFTMKAAGDKLTQTVTYHDFERTFPIDFAFGTAKKGQSYLYWVGNELFQMHVSYLANADRWVNSPGTADGVARYSRPVTENCLSCHSTYFQSIPGFDNAYDKSNYVLGISCERCHGPGRKHIEYHKENPDSDIAHEIVHPGELDRDRKHDLCSQCHAGTGVERQSLFLYRPGEKLENYVYLEDDPNPKAGAHTDNQMARMKISRCFLESEMTCTDCHNPHQHEAGNLELFSQRCLECHEAEHCGARDRVGAGHESNCIDCHMPNRVDVNTPLSTAEGVKHPDIRDHHIRINEAATEKFMQALKGQ